MTITTASDKSHPLRIGVLIHAPVQLLDLSPIDLFGMLTRDYLQACLLPAPLVKLGIPVEIHYISSTPFPPRSTAVDPSASPLPPQEHPPSTATAPPLAQCTANAALRLTADLASPAVSAGSLDIILIPGPDPSLAVPDRVGAFLKAHYDAGATLMSVCTGIYVLAESGVLEEKEATAPRALLGGFRTKWPGVRWVERRWVGSEDARLWSSGGITNGLDMVAAYLRERYPGPLSDTVCMLADVGDRGQEYRNGKARENGLWIWTIVRAWFAGG